MINKILIIFIVLVITSSLKCFIDSNNKKEYLYRRSECQSCKNKLKILDLIPILSYIFLKGRCRYCKNKIPRDILYYELGGAVLVILYFVIESKVIFITFLDIIMIIILYFLAIEDMKKYEVDSTLLIIFFILSLFKGIYSNLDFYNIAIWFIIFHILYFLTRGGIGYGDIKLFCIFTLFLNSIDIIYLLIFTFLYAGLVAVVLLFLKKVTRKTKIPLVPYITLAYITILTIREWIIW